MVPSRDLRDLGMEPEGYRGPPRPLTRILEAFYRIFTHECPR